MGVVNSGFTGTASARRRGRVYKEEAGFLVSATEC